MNPRVPEAPRHTIPRQLITPTKFRQYFSCIHEMKAWPVSGHHIGHYNVVLQSDFLVGIHYIVISLPWIHGTIPNRWTKVIDAILCKKDSPSMLTMSAYLHPPHGQILHAKQDTSYIPVSQTPTAVHICSTIERF
jgi:hypothetical protein